MNTTIISLEDVKKEQVWRLTAILCDRQTVCSHAIGTDKENNYIVCEGTIHNLEITYTGENVNGDDVYCVVIMLEVE